VLLAGGGSGGHVSPLLAVAESLRELAPDAEVRFLGGRRGLEADLVSAAGLPFHAIPMPSLRDPDSRLSLVTRAFLLVPSVIDALLQIARFRPRVCCTSGGLVTLPIVLAARLLRVPVYLWTGDVVPGRVNRLLAGICQRVGATFAASAPWLPRDRTHVPGNPIRRSLLRWTAETGGAALGLDPALPVVLVTGGSQGSERVNEALSAALPQILRRAAVVHHTGPAHLARAEARRKGLPAELQARYHPHGFLRDEMGAALAVADVVVGRAGSSSISEPLAFGKPLVLIPFGAAASGHQVANARAVEETGAATTIREGVLDGDRLAAVVCGLLDDPARLERMSVAARAAGKPEAALTIARELLALGRCV
jgi:UDP-N-acetylglucosamine--N-acetylmuramyl-(pentapeptide) pyrophosphoryl-undecaprenol N-acetylglucosamine transferase